MSLPEAPAKTDIQLLNEKVDAQGERQEKLIEAVNGLGTNVQWIIDNVQGIFQMFSNPQFLAQLPNMMGGTPSDGT